MRVRIGVEALQALGGALRCRRAPRPAAASCLRFSSEERTTAIGVRSSCESRPADASRGRRCIARAARARWRSCATGRRSRRPQLEPARSLLHAALRIDRLLGLVAQPPQARRQARGEREQHERAGANRRAALPRPPARARGLTASAIALVVSSTTTAPSTSSPRPDRVRRGKDRRRASRCEWRQRRAGMPCERRAHIAGAADLRLRAARRRSPRSAARAAARRPGAAERRPRTHPPAARSGGRFFEIAGEREQALACRSTIQMREVGAAEALQDALHLAARGHAGAQVERAAGRSCSAVATARAVATQRLLLALAQHRAPSRFT